MADSSAERTRGLMGVTDLGEADGMLFVFEPEAAHRFYMWHTPLPLDIAFFAADGTFVSSATMEPCLQSSSDSCARYSADAPVLTALEVPAGRLAELGVGLGRSSTKGDEIASGPRIERSGGHPLQRAAAAAAALRPGAAVPWTGACAGRETYRSSHRT